MTYELCGALRLAHNWVHYVQHMYAHDNCVQKMVVTGKRLTASIVKVMQTLQYKRRQAIQDG